MNSAFPIQYSLIILSIDVPIFKKETKETHKTAEYVLEITGL
jgi:hypothetical protein